MQAQKQSTRRHIIGSLKGFNNDDLILGHYSYSLTMVRHYCFTALPVRHHAPVNRPSLNDPVIR
jgi:hypothetical protein